MFVVYTDGNEVLVTTRKREARCLKEWFSNTGRDTEDFDRREFANRDAIRIRSNHLLVD